LGNHNGTVHRDKDGFCPRRVGHAIYTDHHQYFGCGAAQGEKMTPGEIITTIGVLTSLIISVGSAWVQWRKFGMAELPKSGADTASVQVETSIKLVNELREEVDKLRIDVENLRKENVNLRKWAFRLVHQVQELGGVPVEMEHK
jgi:hypothetical protein